MAREVCDKEATVDELVPIKEARKAICYPNPIAKACDSLIEALARNGIRYFVNKGPIIVNGYKVLGKGWASIVFLAKMGKKTVAIKALRPGSRRHTLLHEAAVLLITSRLNISPEPYNYDHFFIAMQYIDSVPLADYAEQADTLELKYVLRRLLTKAHLLDLINISHNELARPHNQVLVEKGTNEPYIIDYEAATITTNPSNLTQLLGGLLRIKTIKKLLSVEVSEIRELLRAYKLTKSAEERSKIANILIDKIAPL